MLSKYFINRKGEKKRVVRWESLEVSHIHNFRSTDSDLLIKTIPP